MKISKLKNRGVAYKINGQVTVFMRDGNSVAATSAAAICYTDNEGYYDVIKSKINYVRGSDIKSWITTKGRKGLNWEKAVKEYNKLNEKGGI